jgi:hypothetical protein
MPGVSRPFTLVDVLGTMNEQNQALGTNDMVNGLGDFGEVDETVPVSDSMTTVVQLNAAWDQGQWGQVTWG